jgi:uncharacterized membrane protein YfhO
VADPETGTGASGFLRRDAAVLERYEAERVEVHTDSPRAGFLVLSDTYRPGWVAEIDGKETPLLVAHTALRGVAVPEGKHQVRFFYRPASLRWGARTSIAALALLAGWVGMTVMRQRRSRGPGEEAESTAAAGGA